MKQHLILITLLSGLSTLLPAATTISINTNIAVSGVRRFGINLAQVNYYDSCQNMKELLFRNPGFEGQIFQSIVPLSSGTATNAIEDGPYTAWPSGFWDGASYEIIWGNTRGRTGLIAHSMAPLRTNGVSDLNGSTNGSTYLFDNSGPAPAYGDYLLLRKQEIGGSGAGAAYVGWQTNASGGGVIASETNDLPAQLNPDSRQCIRLTTTVPGQFVQLTGSFDTWNGVSFVQLNGAYRLTFRAKGIGGASQLLVQCRRGGGSYWINQTILLTNIWRDYTNTFTASETGSAVGPVMVQFVPVNQSSVLLDDVSLRQVDGDPANPSGFRDPVVAALRQLQPAFIRYPNWQTLGETLDNTLAPIFKRMRSGYSSYGTTANGILLGLHEYLGLCELIGADPWFTTALTYSPQEMRNLMEYLGGPANTPYGARRASLGHPAPWTSSFQIIRIEFGNEAWNPTYRGAAMGNTLAYGNRGQELFAAAKASPYYTGQQYNFILGEQWVVPWRVRHTHDACTNHDSVTVAGYMASQIDSYATTEQLFGSLFAEPEWWSKTNGLMYQDYTNLAYSSRPVPMSVYEININVPGGAIVNSQAALSAYAPSLGAGLAVAGHMLMALKETQARDQGLFALGGYEFNAGTNRAFVWGVVRDMGVTNRKRPQYLACQLLNQVLGGNLLQTVHGGDDPTWSVTNVNRVSYTNAHYLQSYAFANGTTNALIVLNLHRTDSLSVNFSGVFRPGGTVTFRQLTSAAITNNNESAETVAVTTQTLTNFDAAAPFSLPPFSLSVFQWQTPPHALAPPQYQPGNRVKVIAREATLGLNYLLQSSTNLFTWDTVTNSVATASEIEITDPNLPPTRKFYRVIRFP